MVVNAAKKIHPTMRWYATKSASAIPSGVIISGHSRNAVASTPDAASTPGHTQTCEASSLIAAS